MKFTVNYRKTLFDDREKSLLHALKKEEVQWVLHLIGSHLLSAISLAVVDLRDLDARY